MTTSLSSPAWLALRTQLRAQTLQLLSDNGVEGWTVVFEEVVTRAGRCVYGTKTISYGIPFMLRSGEKERTNTVLHEVAHALAGPGTGHSITWKRKFISLGGNGERLSYFPQDIYTHDNFLWIGTCPTCNDRTGMSRAPKSVWACATCPLELPTRQRIYSWKKYHVEMDPRDISKQYAETYGRISEKF